MKLKLFVALLSVMSMIAVGSLVADDAKSVDLGKVKCVVSGKAVNPDATADYKDGHVYFCCNGCPGKFAKNTKDYASKANHQLVATHQAKQVGCPVSGKDLDPDTMIEVAGVKVSFCCKNCKGAALKKEGDERVDFVFNDKSFKKGFEVTAKAAHH